MVRSPILFALPFLCTLAPFPSRCAPSRTQTLASLNEPIELSLAKVIPAPTPPVEIKTFLNGKAADWVTAHIDWTGGRILLRLLGDPDDPNAGQHARVVRRMLQNSKTRDKLSLCVKASGTAACAEEIEISVKTTGEWDLLWIAISLASLVLPLFVPKLLRTRVRDWSGKATGEERLSLTAGVFYAWNFAVLISAAYVKARTGEWFLNSTAMALVGLGTAVRGAAKFVPGSRLTPVATQPLLTGSPTSSLRAPAPPPAVTDDPTKPGPAPQPRATPPSTTPGEGPSPNVLSLFQPLLRIFSQTLTDSQGTAMHRIQYAGWNTILLVWYLRAAYLDWALPSFDISLLGLSAASGAFHLASKPAEQMLRSNITAAPPPISIMGTVKSIKRAFLKKRAAAGVNLFLLVFLALTCSFSSVVAQQKLPAKKDTGGAAKKAEPPQAPTGSPPAAGAPKAAANDKPQEREWKLVNQAVTLLPEKAARMLSTKPPHLPLENAKALTANIAELSRANHSSEDVHRTPCSDLTVPWVIQTMVFGKEAAAPARVETALYSSKKEPKEQKDLQRTRIYGSKKVCFVQLVYSSIAVAGENSNELIRDATQVSTDFLAVPMLPEKGVREAEEIKSSRIFVWKAHAAAAQFYAAKGKTAAPLQDLKALALLGFGQAGSAAKTASVQRWLVSANMVDSLPEPSDIWVQTGRVESEYNPTAFTPLSAEVQFDNEGYYWYDFSITLPVNSMKALEYNQGDNNVQTKQVDLKSVYGTANVFLWRSDIRNPSSLWTPRLLFGIGIRGKPFDRTFIGAGFGLNKFIRWTPLQAVQPYGGLSFNRIYEKEGSGASAVLKGRIIRKLVVGVNVPVKSVVDRLKAK